MVAACKQYITEGEHTRIWDVEPSVLLQKLAACKTLYDHYQQSFHASKSKVKLDEKPLEISEMYVFGKFASFCRRLDQIHSVVDTLQQFSVLRDSHIEGIESLANRFNHTFSALKKKPYNPLDHRKTEFNADYDEFQRQISELEDQLVSFMASSFSRVQSCMQTLQLLRRYENCFKGN